MDLLERLRILMDQHGDNNSSLAKKSGVPYTTIDGLYKRGWEKAQLSTIKKLADFYGVSLDYLVYGSDALSDDALMFAAKYEMLGKHGREVLMAIMDVEMKHQLEKETMVTLKRIPNVGEAKQDGTVEMKEAARRELEGVKEEDLIVVKPDLI